MSAPSSLPILVQPASGGRISGGYLYNARMAEHGAWELCDVSPPALSERLSDLPIERPILMDSIWLTAQHSGPFLRRKAGGGRVGAMLHSFPSMIEATEAQRGPRTRPLPLELEVLEALEIVIVPGRHYRDLLAGSRAKVLIAEPGIDDAWRAEPRARSGPCRLVSVGAVTPRKGFLDICDALEGTPAGDYEWSIAGSLDVDAGYAARIVERARRLPAVKLLGQLAPERVRETVQRSDVLIMPSYDENQPLVLLESTAASVPAVAYAAGATRHMLEHGREGFIAEIGDRSALAAYLRRLIEDEAMRWQMAERCWQRQRSLPSWRDAALAAKTGLASAWAPSRAAQA